MKLVPKEGRGSRIRGNDGLQASCSDVPWISPLFNELFEYQASILTAEPESIG